MNGRWPSWALPPNADRGDKLIALLILLGLLLVGVLSGLSIYIWVLFLLGRWVVR